MTFKFMLVISLCHFLESVIMCQLSLCTYEILLYNKLLCNMLDLRRTHFQYLTHKYFNIYWDYHFNMYLQYFS